MEGVICKINKAGSKETPHQVIHTYVAIASAANIFSHNHSTRMHFIYYYHKKDVYTNHSIHFSPQRTTIYMFRQMFTSSSTFFPHPDACHPLQHLSPQPSVLCSYIAVVQKQGIHSGKNIFQPSRCR